MTGSDVFGAILGFWLSWTVIGLIINAIEHRK